MLLVERIGMIVKIVSRSVDKAGRRDVVVL